MNEPAESENPVESLQHSLNAVGQNLENFGPWAVPGEAANRTVFYGCYLQELSRREEVCRAFADVDLVAEMTADEIAAKLRPLIQSFAFPHYGDRSMDEWIALLAVARLGFMGVLPLGADRSVELQMICHQIHGPRKGGSHLVIRAVEISVPTQKSTARKTFMNASRRVLEALLAEIDGALSSDTQEIRVRLLATFVPGQTKSPFDLRALLDLPPPGECTLLHLRLECNKEHVDRVAQEITERSVAALAAVVGFGRQGEHVDARRLAARAAKVAFDGMTIRQIIEGEQAGQEAELDDPEDEIEAAGRALRRLRISSRTK